jgi:hypothetical protein
VNVTLDFVPYGGIQLGVWCDRCFLPSAASQAVAVVLGMMVLAVVDPVYCPDCDQVRTSKEGTW